MMLRDSGMIRVTCGRRFTHGGRIFEIEATRETKSPASPYAVRVLLVDAKRGAEIGLTAVEEHIGFLWPAEIAARFDIADAEARRARKGLFKPKDGDDA